MIIKIPTIVIAISLAVTPINAEFKPPKEIKKEMISTYSNAEAELNYLRIKNKIDTEGLIKELGLKKKRLHRYEISGKKELNTKLARIWIAMILGDTHTSGDQDLALKYANENFSPINKLAFIIRTIKLGRKAQIKKLASYSY